MGHWATDSLQTTATGNNISSTTGLSKSNDHFVLTTDASEVGLGAVNRKRLHHGLLLWKIHGAHVTLHDHEIYWIWNHSVKYYLICQQNTLCSRNQVFHNREGMLSYCVGSQEVSPLLDWDTIYSQNWAQTPRVARLCKKAKPFLMFRTLVRVYEFDILYQPGTQNQAVDPSAGVLWTWWHWICQLVKLNFPGLKKQTQH